MTDLEIKDFLVDVLLDGEDPGDEVTYPLLTHAKDLREAEMELEITKKVNTSNTTSGNETYTTNPVSLPSDFYQPLTRKALYVGQFELFQVPMTERELHKNDFSRFYIDFANNNLYFMGQQAAGQTITIPYLYQTADISSGGGTNSVWPAKFRKLIAFDAAVIHLGGIDPDDINVLMVAEHRVEARRLAQALTIWDHKLKVAAMGGRAGVGRNNRRNGPNRFQP